MERATEFSPRVGRNHALLAALFTVLFTIFMIAASRPVLGGGANLYLDLVATLYFAPAAVALSVAAISQLNEWKHREMIHLLAMAVAIGPALYLVMGAIIGLLL